MATVNLGRCGKGAKLLEADDIVKLIPIDETAANRSMIVGNKTIRFENGFSLAHINTGGTSIHLGPCHRTLNSADHYRRPLQLGWL